MNTKSVISIGLLASILLIFFCIYFNAEKYYEELELGKKNIKVTSEIISDEEYEEEQDNIVEKSNQELNIDIPLNEDSNNNIEEEAIKEETSTFFYHVNNKQKIISGTLPLLSDKDALNEFLLECTNSTSCENRVTFEENSETLSWKVLVLSAIGLYDKVGVENAKISIEKQGIKLEGIFETQESKNHLSSLLIEHKLSYKIYDMTRIVKKEIAQIEKIEEEKPLFRIIKDDSEKEEEIQQAQKEISQLLKEKQIHFEKSSGKITLEGKKVLDELILALKDPNNTLLEVQGHTDAGGKRKSNLTLSQVRASSVKKYLMKKGLKSENITAEGFGESKLLLPETPYSILNRRVEIYLKRK